MKFIVTKMNDDGSFDEVGMSNRAVFEAATKPWQLRKARAFANGKRFRIEYFGNGIYKPHTGVFYYDKR